MKTDLRIGYALRMVAAALSIAGLLSACKKDPDPNDNQNNPPVTTGTLLIQSRLGASTGSGIAGVLVGISPNKANLDAGVPLQSNTSNSLGDVRFSGLDTSYGWWYKATWNDSGSVRTREDSVWLHAGKTRTVTLVF